MQQRTVATSVGSVVLAFLASQHHNLMMLVFAVGLSSAGMSAMTMLPMVRRLMILMSLVVAGVTAYHLVARNRPLGMRLLGVASVALTLGLLAWSVSEFGL
jgi:hypothetical protein